MPTCSRPVRLSGLVLDWQRQSSNGVAKRPRFGFQTRVPAWYKARDPHYCANAKFLDWFRPAYCIVKHGSVICLDMRPFYIGLHQFRCDVQEIITRGIIRWQETCRNCPGMSFLPEMDKVGQSTISQKGWQIWKWKHEWCKSLDRLQRCACTKYMKCIM